MPSGLTEITRSFLLSLPFLSDVETSNILKGVKGRGGFGPVLTQWLQESRDVFPELVRIEYVEAMSDRGVDIWIEGQATHSSIGLQIKSENDIKDDDFFPNIKRQILESRAYPGLELYIVIVACTPQRFMKVQHLFNEALLQWSGYIPEVMVLQPSRAAALLQKCQEAPLDELARESLLKTRNWSQFLDVTGQSRREAEFINRWPGLEPQERFLKPEEWQEMVESLHDSPLTIITGPPATGKTFAASQLLFQHFRQGRPVRWIAANSGLSLPGLPEKSVTPGWEEEVRLLSRTLGVDPPREPVDHIEFVTANLKPDTLVLIEDPFGQNDDDFSRSLHTLDFFDLSSFVEALAEGSKRSSARILITSRQGLFERWQKEHIEGNHTPLSYRIVSLHTRSYEFIGKDWGKHPKIQLTQKLIQNIIDNQNLVNIEEKELDRIASIIANNSESPREIELIVEALKTTITLENAQQCARSVKGGVLERTRIYCQTNNDAERLFFLGLICFDSYRFAPHFTLAYSWVHQVLGLNTNSKADEKHCRAIFRAVYNAIPVYRSIYYKPVNGLIEGDVDAINSIDSPEELLADEVIPVSVTLKERLRYTKKVPIEGRDRLEAAHSTVRDATREELKNHSTFISNLVISILNNESIGCSITDANTNIESHDFNPIEAKRRILVFLLNYNTIVTPEAAEALSSWVTNELAYQYQNNDYWILYSRAHLTSTLFSIWSEIAPVIRNAIIKATEDEVIPAEAICASLAYIDDFPREDAWQFYRLLLQRIIYKNIIPISGFIENGHPFHFMLLHLEEAPPDVLALFNWLANDEPKADFLELLIKSLSHSSDFIDNSTEKVTFLKEISELAKSYKEGQGGLLLAWLLIDICPFFWTKLPTLWQSAIIEALSKDDTNLLKRCWLRINHALIQNAAPQPIINVLRSSLQHTNPEIRTQSGICHLLNWYLLSEKEKSALRDRFIKEEEYSILLEILEEAAQKSTAFIELSRIFLLRSNHTSSVELLKIIFKTIEKSEDAFYLEKLKRIECQDADLWELARDCLNKSGEWGRVAAWNKYGDKSDGPYRLHLGLDKASFFL